jgi:hypothetical protein
MIYVIFMIYDDFLLTTFFDFSCKNKGKLSHNNHTNLFVVGNFSCRESYSGN